MTKSWVNSSKMGLTRTSRDCGTDSCLEMTSLRHGVLPSSSTTTGMHGLCHSVSWHLNFFAVKKYRASENCSNTKVHCESLCRCEQPVSDPTTSHNQLEWTQSDRSNNLNRLGIASLRMKQPRVYLNSQSGFIWPKVMRRPEERRYK